MWLNLKKDSIMDLIQIKKEFRVDSRLLANQLDTRHRTILENIDKYSFELQSLNPLPFETEKGKELSQGGFSKSVRYALLSEDQCYFVLTLMRNNDKVVALKLKLVKAFRDARKQLAERDIARLEGKKVRRDETDAIKELVDYAIANGSENANFYYANITKMTNDVLGIDKGMRDTLDKRQLSVLAMIEIAVRIAINDGLKAELTYKQIFALCKDRISELSPLLKLS
jgi:phage regulator Rha-like protein